MLVAEYHHLDGSVSVGRSFDSVESYVRWYQDPDRQKSMRMLGIGFVTYTEVDPGGLA